MSHKSVARCKLFLFVSQLNLMNTPDTAAVYSYRLLMFPVARGARPAAFSIYYVDRLHNFHGCFFCSEFSGLAGRLS